MLPTFKVNLQKLFNERKLHSTIIGIILLTVILLIAVIIPIVLIIISSLKIKNINSKKISNELAKEEKKKHKIIIAVSSIILFTYLIYEIFLVPNMNDEYTELRYAN